MFGLGRKVLIKARCNAFFRIPFSLVDNRGVNFRAVRVYGMRVDACGGAPIRLS
jgi:hypothetical protein